MSGATERDREMGIKVWYKSCEATDRNIPRQIDFLVEAIAQARAEGDAAGFARGVEAAAQKAENGRFLVDDSREAAFGKACAHGIRALSERGAEGE